MSTQDKEKQTPGTLVKGPDGHLYFIPDSKLSAFRVPDKGTDQMNQKLADATHAVRTTIPSEWINLGLCVMHGGQGG